MQRFSVAIIRNLGSGFTARLSVGADYRGFQILEIQKLPSPPELKDAPKIWGTYTLVVQSPDGTQYSLTNNQEPQGLVYGLNLSVQKLSLLPFLVAPFVYNTNTAEFQHPL